jgi:hypothetical protein
MAYIVKAQDILNRSMIKKMYEQSLVDAIYSVFNSPEVLRLLRATAKAALKSIDDSGMIDPIFRACNEEKLIDVWKNHHARPDILGIKKLLKKADTFSAADCSDIFRLAGAWVEQGGLGATGAAVKEAYRPGVNKDGTPALGTPDQQAHLNSKRAVWGDDSHKTLGKGQDYIDLNYEGVHSRNRTPFDKKKGFFDLPRPVHKRPGQGTAGRELKRVSGPSNVLKIDRLFGLSEMCDISGTTGDSTFAVEVWGHQNVNGVGDLSEIYYILPVGSIAGSAHHSLLEVALVLSLNKVIVPGYQIGFYETLLPNKNIVLPGVLGRIRAQFQAKETHMKNNKLHFLRFYNERREVAGGIVFDGQEIEWLRNKSNLFTATTLLSKMPKFPQFPRYKDVLDLCIECDYGFYRRYLSDIPGAKY